MRMHSEDCFKQTANIIQSIRPNFIPKIGIILGSGLSAIASHIKEATTIPYRELPGFAECTTAGHLSQLSLGYLSETPVVCLQGRLHLYEGYPHHRLLTMIQTIKQLGCESLVITNAAGTLHREIAVGNLILIKDHINLQCNNPLIGLADDPQQTRFVSMTDAYDPLLRQQFIQHAKALSIKLREGVYIGVVGPSFETPAEIRCFRLLGADLIGMSTVGEVIAARYCGLRVTALSVISNMAAGLNRQPLTHIDTIQHSAKSAEKLTRLLEYFCKHYSLQNYSA